MIFFLILVYCCTFCFYGSLPHFPLSVWVCFLFFLRSVPQWLSVILVPPLFLFPTLVSGWWVHLFLIRLLSLVCICPCLFPLFWSGPCPIFLLFLWFISVGFPYFASLFTFLFVLFFKPASTIHLCFYQGCSLKTLFFICLQFHAISSTIHIWNLHKMTIIYFYFFLKVIDSVVRRLSSNL